MEKEKISGKLWAILAICFVSTTVIFIPYYGHSTQTIVMMEDFGLNYTQMGMLDSASAFAAGIVMPFGGMMTYKFGARSISIMGLLIALIGQVMLAFSDTYALLIISRIIQGIGIAFVFVGPYAMVLRWFEKTSHLGFALGVMIACDGAGALVSLYALAFVLAITGWVKGTLVGAIVVAIALIFTIVIMKEPETLLAEKNDEEKKQGSLMKDIKEIYINRNVFAACMFIIPVWGMYAVAAYWVPSSLMEDAGWSESSSGLVGALFSCAGMLSFVFGILSDKMGTRKSLTMISGVGMVAAFLALTIAHINGSHMIMAAGLVVAGFFAYSGLLLAYYLVSDAIGAIKSGAANGLIMSVGYLVGGFVYPVVVGYFKDLTGSYTTGFVAITVTVFIFGVLGVIPAKDTPLEERVE